MAAKKTSKKKATTRKTARSRKSQSGGSAKKKSASKRMGILDAAAEILRKSKKPMTCKDIVEEAIQKKLWSTTGRTPHATLYAAMHREIKGKGKDARFEKVDRGLFQMRKGA